jgi:hypothetical protein
MRNDDAMTERSSTGSRSVHGKPPGDTDAVGNPGNKQGGIRPTGINAGKRKAPRRQAAPVRLTRKAGPARRKPLGDSDAVGPPGNKPGRSGDGKPPGQGPKPGQH